MEKRMHYERIMDYTIHNVPTTARHISVFFAMEVHVNSVQVLIANHAATWRRGLAR